MIWTFVPCIIMMSGVKRSFASDYDTHGFVFHTLAVLNIRNSAHFSTKNGYIAHVWRVIMSQIIAQAHDLDLLTLASYKWSDKT